jgi:L-ornithine Nalpha-acyltransferase
MQGDKLLRPKAGFPGNLRPVMVGAAAHSAVTWFKPPLKLPQNIGPIGGFPVPAKTLGRLGSLEVRLAQEKRDVKRAQKLRYRVFYKDGTAIADAATMLARRDKDSFDKICDHLLVVDHAAKPSLSGKQPRRRHLSLAAARRRHPPWRLLHRRRVRHRGVDRAARGPALS